MNSRDGRPNSGGPNVRGGVKWLNPPNQPGPQAPWSSSPNKRNRAEPGRCCVEVCSHDLSRLLPDSRCERQFGSLPLQGRVSCEPEFSVGILLMPSPALVFEPSVIGGPDADFMLDPICGNSSPTGIGFGPDPVQPVRRSNLVRSGKAGIMPGDDSAG
jgi:hypothetical protein